MERVRTPALHRVHAFLDLYSTFSLTALVDTDEDVGRMLSSDEPRAARVRQHDENIDLPAVAKGVLSSSEVFFVGGPIPAY